MLSLAHVREHSPSTSSWWQPCVFRTGVGWCEKRGRRQTSSPSVFPHQLLLRKWWWRCFEDAYIMWWHEAERMPSGPILPQLSGTNWARSSRLPKASYIYPPRYWEEEGLAFASWKPTLFPVKTNKVTQWRDSVDLTKWIESSSSHKHWS